MPASDDAPFGPILGPFFGSAASAASGAPGAADAERPIDLFREPTPEARRSAVLAEVVAPLADAAGDEASDAEVAVGDAATPGELVQRAINVLLAAVALVALAPLMLAIAVAVRLSSPGPVIYVQERVGLDRRRRADDAPGAPDPGAPDPAAPAEGQPDPAAPGAPATAIAAGRPLLRLERRRVDYLGRPYRMYKFRTMRVDAEKDGRAVWAQKEDPRVTPVGRVLRKLRFDELPQLVNVLHGDMNLVGPRPERPTIVLRLRGQIDGYARRHRVRPGITGWAQINHSYDSCLEDVRTKVRYDLEYVQRRGVAEDLRILWRTIPVVLGRRGGW